MLPFPPSSCSHLSHTSKPSPRLRDRLVSCDTCPALQDRDKIHRRKLECRLSMLEDRLQCSERLLSKWSESKITTAYVAAHSSRRVHRIECRALCIVSIHVRARVHVVTFYLCRSVLSVAAKESTSMSPAPTPPPAVSEGRHHRDDVSYTWEVSAGSPSDRKGIRNLILEVSPPPKPEVLCVLSVRACRWP